MPKKTEPTDFKKDIARREFLKLSTKTLATSALIGAWDSTGFAAYRHRHPRPRPTPVATPLPTPVPTPKATPTPVITPTPTPRATPSPTPSATPSPTPASTPLATPVPTPSSTPSPSVNSALSIPSISVKNYGAVGDGVTDDTAAIQSANNTAAAQGVALYFPQGTYAVTKTLQQTVTWMGPDAGTVYDTDNPVRLLKTNGNTNGSAVVQISASNVSCRYLSCIVSNPPSYDMSTYPTGSSYASNPSYGFYVADSTKAQGLLFYGCSTSGFSIAGIYLGAGTTGQIELCDVRFGAAGILVAGTNCVVIDCTLHHNCGQGLVVNGPGAQMINNRVEWNAAEGISISSGGNFLVSSNLFDRNGKAGVAVANGSGGAVNGNYFSRNGCSGDGTSGRWGFSTPGTESYALISPADSCQIKVSHQSGLTISGNRYRAGQDDSEDGSFSPGYIYNNAGSNSSITVANNAGEYAFSGGSGGYNSGYSGGSGVYSGGSF